MSAQLDTAWSQPRCCPSQIFLSPPASMEPNGRQAQHPVPIGACGGRQCSRLQRLSRLHGIATTDLSPDASPAACGGDGGGRRHQLWIRGAQAAPDSSLALRTSAELSSDRSAAGSPSPVRRDAARRPRCKLRPRFEARTATRCIPARPVPPASSPGPPGVALRTTLTHGRAAPACRLDCPHGSAGSVASIHPTRAGPLTLPHPLR